MPFFLFNNLDLIDNYKINTSKKLQELIDKKNLKKIAYINNPNTKVYKEIIDLKKQINCIKTKLKKKGNSKLKYELK
jgi:hypothetical protein